MLRLHGLCAAGMLSGKDGAPRGSPVRGFAPPPPRRLAAVTSVPSQPVGSSTASESQPGPHTVIGITVSVRRVAEKRNDVQPMSGPAPEGSSGPIGRRVMQRCGLMRQLSFVPSHSGDVLVIPDDDV
ncbi:unnamed protein product [Lactuca virosa]|uniref:Uncharacterized protein n=1 Tax=Lactuca virosa TaxID=75947 RepID=A0AAU9PVC7_9ASTR|nr:unnamed protein product [Lactuca virosa]